MFEFWSKLSFIGKIIFLLGVLVVFCSIVSQCVICDYIPVKFVKNGEWNDKVSSLFVFGNKSKENFEDQENFINVENPKLIYFSSPYCSHCNTYNPIWEQLVIKLKENYPNVNFVKINAVENKRATDDYNINSFPSIIFENKEGKRITFDGDRNSLDDIKEFINHTLN